MSIRMFLFAGVLVQGLLGGTDAADSIKVKYTFNPIVKIATKTAGAQRDLAASITVIEPVAIRESGTSQVFELAGLQVPGLYVTEWGLLGFGVAGQAAGKLSMRGMGGGANTHVLILRNGRPDYMGLMGCTIADEFNTDGVERIEVIRGPASFLYGTNATGGVINLVPRKVGHPGFETHIRAGGGSFQTRELSIGHGGKQGPLDYYLTVSRNTTDGHRKDGNSGYQGSHFSLHTGYAWSAQTQIECNCTLADMTIHDPGQAVNPAQDNWYDVVRYGGDLNLSHFGSLGETQLKLHGNFGSHDFFDGWYSKDRLLGIMGYQTMNPWTGHTLTAGFDWKQYGGDARDASADYPAYYIREYAPYVHLQQLLGSAVIVSAGLRLENHELFGWEILPKAGLVLHFTPVNTFRLSAARGFRSPSIRELYFWMPANASLGPDRVWNYEAGITQEIGRILSLEGVVFHTRGTNLIQFTMPPPRWVNQGEYSTRGFEFLTRFRPGAAAEMTASASIMDLDESIYNTPAQKWSVSMRIHVWRAVFTGSLLHVKDWKGADFSGPSPQPVLVPMNDYTVVNTGLQMPVFRGLGFSLMLRNLFDSQYEAMHGYPMPGRTFQSSVTCGF